MQQRILFILVCAAFLLQACLAPYNFTKDEKTAHLVALSGNGLFICSDGQYFELKKPSGKNYFLIPAGKTVTLGLSGFYSSYPYSYSCTPEISLAPIEGETYLADLHIIRNGCFFDIVDENEMAPLGISPVLTLGPSMCRSKK